MSIPLILASQSPSRRRVLESAGISPVIRVSHVDEPAIVAEAARSRGVAESDLTCEERVSLLAKAKAQAVYRAYRTVADTAASARGEQVTAYPLEAGNARVGRAGETSGIRGEDESAPERASVERESTSGQSSAHSGSEPAGRSDVEAQAGPKNSVVFVNRAETNAETKRSQISLLADSTVTRDFSSFAVPTAAKPMARALAEEPGFAAASLGPFIIGCDSMFLFDGVAFGKPHTPQIARERLRAMRGRSGELWTGHSLVDFASGRVLSGASLAKVTFSDYSDADIEAYVASGEPLEVAGCFTLEGLGGAFIESVDGDPSGVLGLSLPLLRHMVVELGAHWSDLWNTGAGQVAASRLAAKAASGPVSVFASAFESDGSRRTDRSQLRVDRAVSGSDSRYSSNRNDSNDSFGSVNPGNLSDSNDSSDSVGSDDSGNTSNSSDSADSGNSHNRRESSDSAISGDSGNSNGSDDSFDAYNPNNRNNPENLNGFVNSNDSSDSNDSVDSAKSGGRSNSNDSFGPVNPGNPSNFNDSADSSDSSDSVGSGSSGNTSNSSNRNDSVCSGNTHNRNNSSNTNDSANSSDFSNSNDSGDMTDAAELGVQVPDDPTSTIPPKANVHQPGDGWVECACGRRHWGLNGAAGVLLARRDPQTGEVTHIVMQHRAKWSAEGGTWGVPGGAIADGENAIEGALRESYEEAGIDPADVQVVGTHREEHGPWSYTTVLAFEKPGRHVEPAVRDDESIEIQWVPVAQVPTLKLLTAFRSDWPRFARRLADLAVSAD